MATDPTRPTYEPSWVDRLGTDPARVHDEETVGRARTVMRRTPATTTDTRAGPVYVEHLRLALASLDASRAMLVKAIDIATKKAAPGDAAAPPADLRPLPHPPPRNRPDSGHTARSRSAE